MRTRDTGYDDYGLSKERVNELKMLCRSGDADVISKLDIAANAVNPALADDIVYSFVNGISYERLWHERTLYAKRTDFDGYKRKTLYFLDKLLKL